MLVFGVDVPDLSRRGSDDFTYQQGAYTFADINSFNAKPALPAFASRPATAIWFSGNALFPALSKTACASSRISLSPSACAIISRTISTTIRTTLRRALRLPGRPGRRAKSFSAAAPAFSMTAPATANIADLLHYDGTTLLRQFLPSANERARSVSGDSDGPCRRPHQPGGARSACCEFRKSFNTALGSSGRSLRRARLAPPTSARAVLTLFMSRDINAPLAPDYLARPNSAVGQIRQIESEGYQKGQFA